MTGQKVQNAHKKNPNNAEITKPFVKYFQTRKVISKKKKEKKKQRT